jgi:hypothetical protein
VGGCICIDNALTNEERNHKRSWEGWLEKTEIEEKRVKIGYRKIQINGEWFKWDESEDEILEGEKKRRRTGEKR